MSVVTCLLGVALALGVSASAVPAAEAQAEHQAADEAEGGGHQEGGGGVPLHLRTDLAFWSLIVFIVFLLVLKRFAWQPLISSLDDREARIRQNIADAETARKQAEQLLAEHQKKLDNAQEEVKEILAEARRDAERVRQDILSEARREAESTRQRAIDDIERARDQALDELFEATANQVVGATEHILRRVLSDEDRTRLVDEALEQVSVRSRASTTVES